MRYVDQPQSAFGAASGPAEPVPRRPLDLHAMALPLMLALCCSGCSLLPGAPAEAQPAGTPPVATKAAVSTTAPAASAVAPKPVETEAAVPPAAQRAFDDARRAMRAGRMDEAERGFKSVIQFHPELGGPHANLGVIYRQANKLPESVAALEQAVKLSPRQPVYFNQLGITYRLQGQFAKAREAYERAIDLNPEYATATLNLGILSDLYLWDGKRALELYDRYLALTPGGDATVTKWVADLKNRNKTAQPAAATERKENE
jgi:Flp pilus assembly protein TadD